MTELDATIQSQDESSLEAYYGLPRAVRFCTRCVISNQRPSSVVEYANKKNAIKPTIQFDENGVCSACQYADIKDHKIDWQSRERDLEILCANHRSKDGSYDCIVPGSGGKDSSFTAHILKTRYGMNPLTVTWAPHLYTDVGWRNLHHWIDSGLDNILFTPNGELHKFLTQQAFLNLVHPFQPFIIGQRYIGPRFSTLYNIPLVFYGENQAEYGNNIEENNKPTMDLSFFAKETPLNELFLGGISAAELIKSHKVNLRDLNPYLPVNYSKIQNVGTEVHYLGYYLKWDPQECFYYAAENCGYETNTERTEGSYSKYSSIDDKIDPLHYFTTYIKFGIGRTTYDAAQEIRNRKISREEGIALVNRFDHEFPSRFFKEILDYMSITEEQFWQVIDNARSPHLWEKRNDQWQLRHQIS